MRVKTFHQIVVRDGKGLKDRATMLPRHVETTF
jgi:hypothetical protein